MGRTPAARRNNSPSLKAWIMLAHLRKTIAALERPPGLEDPGVQPFAIPAIDTVLGGGLVRGALHEIAAVNEVHIPAATSFALNISLHTKRKTVWVTEDMALAESGAPCGTGLEEFGFAPENLLTVDVRYPRDLLWAMEEALHCRAVGAVIGEFRHEAINSTALRRLSLAAVTHGAVALLLRATPPDDVSTAATRWIVGAARSRSIHGPGPPRLIAQLVRNRRGPLGTWELEWSVTDECFVLASTHPEPVVRPPVDRPTRAFRVA
jgi:protein ImuA